MFDPQNRMVTQRFLAKKLGVSPTTVSLALKDSSRVSRALRDRVQRLAEECNYRPDPLLQQLSSYKNSSRKSTVVSSIAWINDWVAPDQFFEKNLFKQYYDGAQQMAEKLGYAIEVFNTHQDGLSQQRLKDILVARGIRGIIIPPHPVRYIVPSEIWSGFSILRIGFNNPTPRNHVVSSDQYEGGRLAAKNMLEAGYQKIGYIGNRSKEQRSRHNFLSGFNSERDSLVPPEHRIPALILDTDDNTNARDLFEKWLTDYSIDAVLSAQGNVEEWTIELNLKIGSDLGLAATCINDSELDSGIDQKPVEVGNIAVQYLTQLIAHHKVETPELSQRLLISPTWVGGSSLIR
ncbi:MAG: LacI family DNA-binding transcriptional regulator [Opitutaceae bacterium]